MSKKRYEYIILKPKQRRLKVSKAICGECGSTVEIADGKEWGYCPMCENDQVELKKKPKEMMKSE